MNQCQYRVVLFDPTVDRPERPVQSFVSHITKAEESAKKYLEGAGEGSEVWLYRMEETLEGSWRKKISVSLPENKDRSGNLDLEKELVFKTSPGLQTEQSKQ